MGMLTNVFEGLKHVFEERVRYSRLRKLAGLHAADDGKKVVNGSLGVIAGAVVVAEMPALVTVPGVGRESKSFVDSDCKCVTSLLQVRQKRYQKNGKCALGVCAEDALEVAADVFDAGEQGGALSLVCVCFELFDEVNLDHGGGACEDKAHGVDANVGGH